MRILKEPVGRYTYAFEYPFSYAVLGHCRKLKEKYGSRTFGFYKRKWRFTDPGVTYAIKDLCPEAAIDASMTKDLEMYELTQKKNELKTSEALRLKKAKTSSLEIIGIKGELYPFQKLGVEFFMNSEGRAILADQMGTGKTLQSLAYVVHTRQRKTVVICPAVAKYNWDEEVKKWTKLKPYVIDSKSKFDADVYHEHDVFIINYDLLKKFFKPMSACLFDCLIVDEFHYVKSPSAQRTKYTMAFGLNIPSVLLLSGTPLLNRPVELFTGLQMVDPAVWNDYIQYTRLYCDGHNDGYGWNAKGASRIPELRERIAKYFLRRTKAEVLPELPKKRRIEVPVELDDAVKSQYDACERGLQDFIATRRGSGSQYYMDALSKLTYLRQLSTRGKVYAAKDLIDNIIDSGEKVVVFSVYNEPLEELKRYYGDKAVLLTGKVEAKERHVIKNTFQSDESVKVFLGGLVSAGVAITLTAASNVVFIDYSWVPAEHRQAEDRIHRPGQEADSVAIYQLFSRHTIDERMKEVLTRKQEIFDQVIEGEEAKELEKMNILKDVLTSYERDRS